LSLEWKLAAFSHQAAGPFTVLPVQEKAKSLDSTIPPLKQREKKVGSLKEKDRVPGEERASGSSVHERTDVNLEVVNEYNSYERRERGGLLTESRDGTSERSAGPHVTPEERFQEGELITGGKGKNHIGGGVPRRFNFAES